jgi:EmrB/QacA subfamily drug resistance transporter
MATNAAKNKNLSRHSDNKWIILGLLALAQFMVILDVAIVNVALPTISRKLHFAPNDLQWVVTAYTLTFGGFLLLGGRASDLLGRRRIFIIAVTAFSIMSLLCGLAQSESNLIITRALQGLAAAIMSPAALSIVLAEFEEGKERNNALGIWGAVAAGGAAAGVLLGGTITQYLGWRWNFFVNVPVGIFVVLASMRLLKHNIGEENKKIKLDLTGAVLATTGLMSLVFGLSKAPTLTWHSATVWEFIAAGLVLIVGFIINENRVDQPLMPLEIFKIRNVAGGNTAFIVISCTMFSMFFFLTLYIQNILHYDPVKTGLCFLPITFIIGIMSAIVSNVVGKIGYKPPMALGPLVLGVGLYILSHSLKVGGNYLHNVLPGLATCAVGMGMTFVSGTLAATSGVPKHFAGLASGILNTSQQVGGAIGLAVLSAVAYSTVRTSAAAHSSKAGAAIALVHGYSNALRLGAALAIVAAIVVLVVVKNQKVDAREAMTAAAG